MISHESKKPFRGVVKHRGLLLAPLPQADDAAFANELDFSYEVRIRPSANKIHPQIEESIENPLKRIEN